MRLRRLRGAACHTLDLMYGTAGTLLGAVYLYSLTGASEFLDDALLSADRLALARLPAPNGRRGCCWEISASPDGPAIPYLGLLHGSAGLGLALAHLARVTGDEGHLEIAASGAELLLEEATPAPGSVPSLGRATDDKALTWPRYLDDTGHGVQAHCHGAGGIGQFLLMLHGLRPDPRYLSAAEGAAWTILGRSARETRTGPCHGLSGAGHFFLDLYQACQAPQWLTFAQQCGDRLQAYRIAERTGVYTMDGKNAVSADLMIGYAGVGGFLLRLADPARAPICSSVGCSPQERGRRCQKGRFGRFWNACRRTRSSTAECSTLAGSVEGRRPQPGRSGRPRQSGRRCAPPPCRC